MDAQKVCMLLATGMFERLIRQQSPWCADFLVVKSLSLILLHLVILVLQFVSALCLKLAAKHYKYNGVLCLRSVGKNVLFSLLIFPPTWKDVPQQHHFHTLTILSDTYPAGRRIDTCKSVVSLPFSSRSELIVGRKHSSLFLLARVSQSQVPSKGKRLGGF